MINLENSLEFIRDKIVKNNVDINSVFKELSSENYLIRDNFVTLFEDHKFKVS